MLEGGRDIARDLTVEGIAEDRRELRGSLRLGPGDAHALRLLEDIEVEPHHAFAGGGATTIAAEEVTGGVAQVIAEAA